MYLEMLKRHQEETNKLPLICAFSTEQMFEACEKHGIKVWEENGKINTDKTLVPLGCGVFCTIEDFPLVKETLNRHCEEERALLDEPQTAYEAFSFQLRDQEYAINYEGDYDVVCCFGKVEYAEEKEAGDYLRDLGCSEDVIRAFYEAKKDYYASEDCDF